MFATRMMSMILACGLVAGGAVAVAQQASRDRAAAPSRPRVFRSTAPAAARGDAPAIDEAALAKEINGLELGLLEDEVKLLREQVSAALKDRVQYESSATRVDPKASDDVQLAYQKAREAYLGKARELAIAKRRLGKVEEPAKAEAKGAGDAAKGDDHSKGATPPGSSPPASGASIGSIDMGAVLKGYEKVRQYEQQSGVDRDATRARIAKLQFETQALGEQMERLPQGGAEYRARAERIAALKDRIRRETEGFQEGQERRQSRDSVGVLREIQEVIAAVAAARGLDYVVKVAPPPQPGATYNDVVAAMNRAILYASPRHDITDEVIRELNRRFEVAGEKPR